jgi:hypothetical protein
MKYNKIISFALVNAFALLMFATLLSSCQKNSIAQQGHFTSYYESRSPASAEQKPATYDFKQVYLYCKLNAVDTKSCFEKTLTKILNDKVRDNVLEKDQAQQIKSQFSYNYIHNEIVSIANNISVKMDDEITKYYSKRKTFCVANAKKDLKRCLHRHLHADALKVLNNYQKKAPNLNGQEYLFLKDHFRHQFISRYDEYLDQKQI